jgi:MFS transporter, Spinster family, sphingosine-1-phosphate transporter
MISPAPDARQQPVSGSLYPWICVALLSVVWLLNYLDREVIFSVFPLLQKEMKLSSVELGLIGTAFLWVYAFAGPVSGYFGDRFGRKRMILLSLAVWSALTVLTGTVRSLPQLLTTRALMGISEAFYLPAGLALIASWHAEKTRGKATGIHYVGGYLGMVIGGGLGGWLGMRFGWRLAFLVLGVIGIGYSGFLLFALREPDGYAYRGNHPTASFFKSAVVLFRTPGYPSMFVAFALTSIGNWISYTWLPLYLYERFGMSLAKAGFSATFYLQAGSFAGMLLGGIVADHWVARRPRARVLVQAAGLLAAAPCLFLAGFTASVSFLLGGMLIFGAGRGIYDANCMPALCQIAPDELHSTGFGFFNFIGSLTGGIVAVGAGALKSSIGIGGTLEIAGVLLAVSSLLLARIHIAGSADTLKS